MQITDNFAIVPYAGFHIKVFAFGNWCEKHKYDGKTESENHNLISDDVDYDPKRFHVGGHIGVDAHCNQFVFGFSYGGDFTKLVDYGDRISSFKFRVGINF